MKYYKGFNKDMTCRGFQFKEGETYETNTAKLCKSGFHACEMPLDCFKYYTPSMSEYHEVELEDVSPERDEDTKVCAKRIKIGAKLGIAGIVKAQIEYVNEHTDQRKAKSITGDRGAASATGDWGAASATGVCGAASATGDWGAASATGERGAASATGVCGAASATGVCGAASATGVWGAASATGYRGAASATGVCGAASATGVCGAASATGYRGAASATGDCGAASATGDCGAASATGDDSIAIAAGYQGKAKAPIGSAICVCERGAWNGKTYPLLSVKAAIVDGVTIKPNTWYTLKNGKFVEVEQ